MRDFCAMIISGLQRRWCWAFHRSMWKVWDSTTQYGRMFCRICGREHVSRVGPERSEAPILPLIQWPVSMAARWYRHHVRGG